MSAGLLLALFLSASGYSLKAQAQPQSQAPDVPTEAQRELFTKGQTLFEQGLYGEAVLVFSEFLKSFPNSSLKDLNLLWLGRSYLRQGDIASAETMNLRLREMPDTPYLGIYEEELRTARQNYVRLATLASGRRNDAGPKVTPSKPVSPDESKISTLLTTPASTLASNQPGDRAKTSASPSVQIKPATSNVVAPPQKERQKERGVLIAAPASANVVAPLVRLRIEELPALTAANGAVSYRLVLINEGNGAAKDLTVREQLDSSLDFVSSDLEPARQEIVARMQLLTFRIAALGPGETKVIRLAVRSRQHAAVNTATQTKRSIVYRDGNGKSYSAP